MENPLVIQVEAANADFYEALESGSMSKMDDIWLHEDWVQCVHPGWDLITGWRRVRESWSRIFDGNHRLRISAGQIWVRPAGEAAIVTCIEQITAFSGSDFDSMQAVATNIFLRRKDRWLMSHHHASPLPVVLPQPATDAIQ